MDMLRDRFEKALQSLGYTRATLQPRLQSSKTFSRKYIKYERAGHQTVWLGRAGAVRLGPTVTASFAMSDEAKAKLLASAGLTVPQKGD